MVPAPVVPWRRMSRRSPPASRRSTRRCVRAVRRSWRRCVRSERRSWRRSVRSERRSSRPCIPVVCASASGLVSTVTGAAKANAAASPRSEAIRREIICDLMSSFICNLRSLCQRHPAAEPWRGAMTDLLLPSTQGFPPWCTESSIVRVPRVGVDAHQGLRADCGVARLSWKNFDSFFLSAIHLSCSDRLLFECALFLAARRPGSGPFGTSDGKSATADLRSYESDISKAVPLSHHKRRCASARRVDLARTIDFCHRRKLKNADALPRDVSGL